MERYTIYFRYDRHERSYEIWVEDNETEFKEEVYHEWVGDRISLQYELKELSETYKTKRIKRF